MENVVWQSDQDVINAVLQFAQCSQKGKEWGGKCDYLRILSSFNQVVSKIGLAQKQQKKLFEFFWKIENEASPKLINQWYLYARREFQLKQNREREVYKPLLRISTENKQECQSMIIEEAVSAEDDFIQSHNLKVAVRLNAFNLLMKTFMSLKGNMFVRIQHYQRFSSVNEPYLNRLKCNFLQFCIEKSRQLRRQRQIQRSADTYFRRNTAKKFMKGLRAVQQEEEVSWFKKSNNKYSRAFISLFYQYSQPLNETRKYDIILNQLLRRTFTGWKQVLLKAHSSQPNKHYLKVIFKQLSKKVKEGKLIEKEGLKLAFLRQFKIKESFFKTLKNPSTTRTIMLDGINSLKMKLQILSRKRVLFNLKNNCLMSQQRKSLQDKAIVQFKLVSFRKFKSLCRLIHSNNHSFAKTITNLFVKKAVLLKAQFFQASRSYALTNYSLQVMIGLCQDKIRQRTKVFFLRWRKQSGWLRLQDRLRLRTLRGSMAELKSQYQSIKDQRKSSDKQLLQSCFQNLKKILRLAKVQAEIHSFRQRSLCRLFFNQNLKFVQFNRLSNKLIQQTSVRAKSIVFSSLLYNLNLKKQREKGFEVLIRVVSKETRNWECQSLKMIQRSASDLERKESSLRSELKRKDLQRFFQRLKKTLSQQGQFKLQQFSFLASLHSSFKTTFFSRLSQTIASSRPLIKLERESRFLTLQRNTKDFIARLRRSCQFKSGILSQLKSKEQLVMKRLKFMRLKEKVRNKRQQNLLQSSKVRLIKKKVFYCRLQSDYLSRLLKKKLRETAILHYEQGLRGRVLQVWKLVKLFHQS